MNRRGISKAVPAHVVLFAEPEPQRILIAHWLLRRVKKQIIDPIQEFLDGRPGPRPQLDVYGCLFAWVLVALNRQEMHQQNAWRALIQVTRRPTRRLLGIEWNGHVVTYDQFHKTWRKIVKAIEVMNPSATDDGDGGVAFIDWIVDRILDASIPKDTPRSSSWAIDGTSLPTWAHVYFRQGKGKQVAWTKDPGAGPGHLASKNGHKGGYYQGREVHLMVQSRDLNGRRVPFLIVRLSAPPAGTHQGEAAIRLLTRAAEDGLVGDLELDRSYSMKDAHKFHQPAQKLGYRLSIDLAQIQRTPRQPLHGATVRDGWVFCPAMPSTLLDLPPIKPDMPEAELLYLTALYDERAKWAFATRKKLGEGRLAIECPARRGTVRCPLVAKSMMLTTAKPTVVNPPEAPEAACTQSVVILPADVAAGERQQHLYGTSVWVKSYHRRSAVENANSNLKVHYACVERSWTRSFNDVNVVLLLGITAAVMNLRIARRWAQDHGGRDPVDPSIKYPALRTRPVAGTWDDVQEAS